MMMKALLCQAIQSQVHTQVFDYRVEYVIKQVGYKVFRDFFVHIRYIVEVVSPLRVLDQPHIVTNQVDLDFLFTVCTQAGQILDQVGDAHELDVRYEGLHEIGWQTDMIRVIGNHISFIPAWGGVGCI